MVSQKENKAKNRVFGIKVLDFSLYSILFSIISFGNKEFVLAIICYLIYTSRGTNQNENILTYSYFSFKDPDW